MASSKKNALSISDKKLHTLINAMPMLVSYLDAQMCYRFCNQAYEQWYGRSAADIYGKHIHEVIGSVAWQAVSGKVDQVLRGDSVTFEHLEHDKNGDLRWVQINLIPDMGEDGKVAGFFNISHDLTERKEAAQEKQRTNHLLGERIKELTTLHAAGEILGSDQKPIPDALREIVSILPPGWQYPEITAARIMLGEAEYATPNFSAVEWKQSAEFHTFDGKTCLLEVVYLVECPPEAEGPFLSEERNLINTLAEMLQIYLDRRHAREQVQRQLERLTALHTIDVTITSSLDLHYTLGVILEQVTTRLDVAAADILLINGQTQMLEFAVGRGFRSVSIERTRLRLGESYAGYAALKRQTTHPTDLTNADGDFAKMLQTENFADYYCAPLIAKGQVKGVIEVFHRALLHPDADWLSFLEALATQTAIAIDNIEMFNGLQSSNLQLTLAYETTLEGWVYALDLRDKETEGHTKRVMRKTLQLARVMGLTEEHLIHLQRGALLHDIGKMGIPDSILLKPGPLTEDEWALMRRHPVYAYEWLYPIAYLRPALDIPYCHHEKWDGSGYPRGLKNTEIPLGARIFSVVDVWDALRFDRPYRPAWSEERVREYIRSLAGIHFDPQVVTAFLGVVDDEK